MGLSHPLVYLDACVLIYFVEEHPRFHQAVRLAMDHASPGQICISPLTELEYLVAVRVKLV